MTNNNIVVFDLDETLGDFTQLSIFWEALNKFHKFSLHDDHFFKLLDMFPEYLRPNIFNILKYILKQKRNNKCDNIMIYTNNQGNKNWITMITRYFDMRLNQQTFDKIISAFKVNGKRIELCRTSHSKSVSDLFSCTQIPENTQICFIDDQIHPFMKDNNVYYINVKPYNYSIDFEKMANIYFSHIIKIGDKYEFINYMSTYMNKSGYIYQSVNRDENNIDKIISKQLLIHIKDFFGSNNKTKRKIRRNKNRTVKL
jgi:hypothetical protein|tara:strand:- start:2407 stop:3174 length:768 start_codon:yes stop_codon:yes gene_type:complete